MKNFFYVKQVYNSCVKENQTFCFKVELGWTLNLNKDYLPSRNSGNFRPKPITKSRKQQQQQLSAITPPPFPHRVYDNLILYQLFSKIPWGFFKFRDVVVVESIPLSLSFLKSRSNLIVCYWQCKWSRNVLTHYTTLCNLTLSI